MLARNGDWKSRGSSNPLTPIFLQILRREISVSSSSSHITSRASSSMRARATFALWGEKAQRSRRARCGCGSGRPARGRGGGRRRCGISDSGGCGHGARTALKLLQNLASHFLIISVANGNPSGADAGRSPRLSRPRLRQRRLHVGGVTVREDRRRVPRLPPLSATLWRDESVC
jgi:hypothetical protein